MKKTVHNSHWCELFHDESVCALILPQTAQILISRGSFTIFKILKVNVINILQDSVKEIHLALWVPVSDCILRS